MKDTNIKMGALSPPPPKYFYEKKPNSFLQDLLDFPDNYSYKEDVSDHPINMKIPVPFMPKCVKVTPKIK